MSACPSLSVPRYLTCPTEPCPPAHNRVLFGVLVPRWAVRLAPVGVILAVGVLARCDRLKVGGVNAPSVTAFPSTAGTLLYGLRMAPVVDLQALRYVTLHSLVNPPVGRYAKPAGGVRLEPAIPSPARLTGPDQAPALRVEFGLPVEPGYLIPCRPHAFTIPKGQSCN